MSVRRLVVCLFAAAVACAASTLFLSREPAFEPRAMEPGAVRTRLTSAYQARTHGQRCPKAPVQSEFWPLSQPVYGQPVRLVLSVLPFEPGPAAEIGFDVPEGVRFSGQRLRRGLTLPANRLSQFTIDVVIERPGQYTLEAWAIMGGPAFRFGRRVRLFFDASADGIRVSNVEVFSPRWPGSFANAWTPRSPIQPPPRNPQGDVRLPLPAVPEGAVRSHGNMSGTATTTMWGYVYWFEGGNNPAYGATIQAWDQDSYSADDYLGATVVDQTGYWALTFDNDTDGFFETGTADFYAIAYAQNAALSVTDGAGNVYGYVGDVLHDIPAGTNYYETFQITTYSSYPGQAFAILGYLTSAYVALTYFGQPHYTSSVWPAASGAYYDPAANRIYFRYYDYESPDVVLHEYAHSSMDTVYGEDYIPYTPTGTRSPKAHTSPNAAMAEGYATFLACFMNGRSTYNDYTPNNMVILDIEPNWDGYGTANGNADGLSTGANSGHDTEASVASLFWDINDEAQDQFDFMSYGIAYILGTLYDYHPRTAQVFFNGWKARGNQDQTKLAGQMQVHGMDQGAGAPTIGVSWGIHNSVGTWYWSGKAGVSYDVVNYGSLSFPVQNLYAALVGPSGEDLLPQLGSVTRSSVPPGGPISVALSVPHLNPVTQPALGTYTVKACYKDAAGTLLSIPVGERGTTNALTMNVLGDPDGPDFCTVTLPDGPMQTGDQSVRVHVESADTESDIAGYSVSVGLAPGTFEFSGPWYYSVRGATSWAETIQCSNLPHGIPLYVSVTALNVMAYALEATPVTFKVGPTTVSGTVTFEDWRRTTDGYVAMIEIRAPGTTTVLETHAPMLSPSGAYSFQTYLAGTYDLLCGNGHHWLRKKLTGFQISGQTAQASFSLVNGDVDFDNAITVFDYNLLSAAFDSTYGDGTYDYRADLDGDYAVTVFDYNILSANFDRVGDE